MIFKETKFNPSHIDNGANFIPPQCQHRNQIGGRERITFGAPRARRDARARAAQRLEARRATSAAAARTRRPFFLFFNARRVVVGTRIR